MGRKKSIVNVNIEKRNTWVSLWYSYKKDFSMLLQQDLLLNSYFRSLLSNDQFCNLVGLRVFRFNNFLVFDVLIFYTILFSRKHFDFFVEKISIFLRQSFFLTVFKISSLDVIKSGFYLAFRIAKLIEKRVKFRSKTIKFLMKKVKENCKGIYIQCKGRLNNVDIARSDKLYLGSISMQTIDFLISFGHVIANTIKGLQSIKVWINF